MIEVEVEADPVQVEIIEHPARIKVAVCGRR